MLRNIQYVKIVKFSEPISCQNGHRLDFLGVSLILLIASGIPRIDN